jgi:glycosyltransferase involved in cell wall biosynthesis
VPASNSKTTTQPGSPSPLVSVVIPSYNYAHYLPAAVHSVLAQTFSDLELIIIDDGSTDNTREAAAKFTDPRMRYVFKTNGGLASARNAGIANSRGKFLAFLDTDDLWLPQFLETVLATFGRLPPGFAAVATSSQRIDPDGKPIVFDSAVMNEERELTTRDFVFRNRPLSSSIVIRREVFEKCGLFDESLRSSEDRDMWIRLTTRFRFFYLRAQLARLRRHPHNMSRDPSRMTNTMARVIGNAWRRRDVPRSRIFFWARVLANYLVQAAWLYHDAGMNRRAVSRILLSLLCWPLPMPRLAMGEQPFFRLRAIARFTLKPLFSRLRPAAVTN